MKFRNPKNRKMIVGAAGALLLLSGPGLGSLAHAAEQRLEPLPEVLVEAGPVNRAVVGRAAATNAPIESTTVDYHVRYSDLDLVKHADVLTLQQRVETAAREACRQLDELFPVDVSRSQTLNCTQDAVRGAADQMQQAITAAQDQHADS